MATKEKVEFLAVDTSAFIKNAQLQDIAENIFTIPEVVNEIKSKRQLRQLVVLPYDLKIKQVDPDDVAVVKNFSLKTGDYPSLSATDLKVLALAYSLHKEKLGLEGIKTEPTKTIVSGYPTKNKSSSHSVSDTLPEQEVPDIDEVRDEFEALACKDDDSEEEESKEEQTEDTEQEINEDSDENEESEDEHTEKNTEQNIDTEEDSDDNEQTSDENEDDSDGGWITPMNINKIRNEPKKKHEGRDYGSPLTNFGPPPKVACLSTDFAIQNVLKQMGMHVVSINGLLIKQMKTYILRCYGCLKTTSRMEKVFCPNCGNKTLKRVAVTVDENGKQMIHINFKRQLSGKGKKFPLPKFKGGKHANNPIICEDQRVPQQRASKSALMKMNPMNPDYIAGTNPFLMRDIYSKSSIPGYLPGNEVKYWMRKNPNQVTKRRRKK